MSQSNLPRAPGTVSWHWFSYLRKSPDVSGERIRQDVTEDQDGVPLAVDIQVVDMDTCEPIPGAYLEIWRKWNPPPSLRPV